MIELINVSRKFDERGIAGINGINLSLEQGEILSVMGPNGSGKTTLINVIAGKIGPDHGEVKLDGDAIIFAGIEDVKDMNVQKFLISRNTHDIDEEKKLQLARDFADIFEFTFQLRQNLSQLSAGQKQKVALASVLINHPRLILLDEPFTHLDPHTRKDILNSLFTYIRNQGISVLWVTHELDEALNFSDRIGILNFGKFEQIGRPEAVVENPRNLFVAQFLGYENFLPLKRDDQGWSSPWGSISGGPLTPEALLVIPANAWWMTKENPNAEVISHTLRGYQRGLNARIGEKEVQVTLTRSIPLPSVGSRINLEAVLADCFLIPL